MKGEADRVGLEWQAGRPKRSVARQSPACLPVGRAEGTALNISLRMLMCYRQLFAVDRFTDSLFLPMIAASPHRSAPGSAPRKDVEVNRINPSTAIYFKPLSCLRTASYLPNA
ncbi:hypothetical protein [Mucilaginibacter psychrotolerans]|uniref:Uncharacterized protein n=1 Tax=Mucilaginibacter psychrotolerans TaxID=1524096 RepID=A0A4Y8S2Z6_9SPHI|nr:hypothetical protein [Mucilaginibacter psychrotolerans]TFF33352.1 hypothetical protein E2R66_26195 [Mucilaginibacter psychrotolerans]